jgi:hypothetical protein
MGVLMPLTTLSPQAYKLHMAHRIASVVGHGEAAAKACRRLDRHGRHGTIGVAAGHPRAERIEHRCVEARTDRESAPAQRFVQDNPISPGAAARLQRLIC